MILNDKGDQEVRFEKRGFVYFKYFVLMVIYVSGCTFKLNIHSDQILPGHPADYHTFEFYNPANLPESNFSFNENQSKIIFESVAGEMQGRNYKSNQKADLMIKIQGGIKNTTNIRNENMNYSHYYPYRYRNYYNEPKDEKNNEIILIIDVIEERSDKLIWQGVATGMLKKKDNDIEQLLKDAIKEIFLEYPYIAGSN